MDNNTAIVIMTIVAVIAGAALAIFAIRRPREAAAALDAIQDGATWMQDNANQIAAVFALARDLAASAEQMSKAGAIDKADRLDSVITRLREIFPDLSDGIARAAAEAGAYWINQIGRGAQLERPAPPQVLPLPATTTTPPEPQP